MKPVSRRNPSVEALRAVVLMLASLFLLAGCRERSLIQLLSKLLWQTVYLVEGNFAPLNPALGLQCRWCGIGTYKLHARVGGPSFIDWIGGPGLRALQCSHC